MEFNELKHRAEAMGFTFDLQTWIPDDYWEDEDGRKHTMREEVSAWKVTFPSDYPRPAHWINEDDDTGQVKSLRSAIDEYNRRFEIYEEMRKKSQQTIDAMEKFKQKFGQGIN